MIKRLLIVLAIILIPCPLWAACSGASPTLTAASPNRSDVNDCVTAATYGDTINIPAGIGTGWTSGITITKDIKIIGAGIASTFIDLEISTIDSGVFIFQPDATAETNIETLESSGTLEITGITFASLKPQTATIAKNLELLKVDGSTVSKVIRRIRVHHNRVIYMSHLLGQEVGFSHGVFDNNYLFNTSLYYSGASTYSISNLIYPGDGKGWFFEDNIIEWSSPSLRRGTTSAAKVKNDEFIFWLDHAFHTAAAGETSLPEGTIPTGKYGIFKVSINTSENITITAGANNATGYNTVALAIAGIPATPDGERYVAGFYIYNNSGSDFVNGTTNLNATGVTTVFGENSSGGFIVGGGNNGGAGFTVRYNKALGYSPLTVAADTYYDVKGSYFFDEHSNQTGITGGQQLEMYGNNFISTLYNGDINVIIQSRGQKNLFLYNLFPANSETNTDIVFREEMNDGFSVGDGVPGSASTIAALAALNMCESRTTYNGTPAPQVCPGYYVGLPDRIATRCGCWKVHDSYVFNNRKVGGTLLKSTVEIYGSSTPFDYFNGSGATRNDPVEIVENREFFNYVALAAFDGSAGVTCGTSSQMNAITPTVTGVGFWVPTDIATMPCTSLSDDNIKQTDGVNPVTPITGTLYKWDGDSWEPFWEPYTYPHPLRGEGTSAVTVTVNLSGTGAVMSHSGETSVLTGGTINISASLYNGHKGEWATSDADKCAVASCPTTEGQVNTCSITPSGACTVTFTVSEIKLLN